jgi:hypothetical protein
MTGRPLDPQGKSALFSAQVPAAPDTLATGPASEGKEALYSTGPRRAGTVVVACSGCTASTRTSLLDLGLRMMNLAAWIPGRRYGHRLRCPACRELTWCSIAFTK